LDTTPIQAADYREENKLFNDGFKVIAGVDEVGRGPVAGPVVVGIAIMPYNPHGEWLKSIKDSKLLSHTQRIKATEYMNQENVLTATGSACSIEIDKLGIVRSTSLAAKRAIAALGKTPEILLVDGFKLPEISLPQKPIIKGDRKCLSIAAASIIAKVTRDNFMCEQHTIYPSYSFDKNKGYLTKEHNEALQIHGPCQIHRYSFEPIFSINTKTLFD
jgi:ribonuclease HII